MRLIFLDFDGVLHPGLDGDLSCLPLLVDALADHRDVWIVVASGWRRQHSRTELRAMLRELAARYLGETPVLSGKTRHDEVLEFLRRRQLRRLPWVALEDDRRNYPTGLANVIWCSTERGFDADAAERLAVWLESCKITTENKHSPTT